MKKYFALFLPLSVAALLICLPGCQSQKTRGVKGAAHHCNLAKLSFQQGRIQEAIAEVRTAIEMDPKNPEYYQWLGLINFSAGKYHEAEEAYLQALKLDPYLTEVHNYLGVLCDQMGRREEALRHFEVALRDKFYATPENIYFNLSQLYEKEGNVKEAVLNLRKAIEKNLKFYRAHYQLARLLDKLGNYEEALFEYKVAEVAYRQDFDFHYLFAMTCMKKGDKEGARLHFMKVIELAPGTPDAIRAREIIETLK